MRGVDSHWILKHRAAGDNVEVRQVCWGAAVDLKVSAFLENLKRSVLTPLKLREGF